MVPYKGEDLIYIFEDTLYLIEVGSNELCTNSNVNELSFP